MMTSEVTLTEGGPPRARSNLCRGHFSAQAHHAPASAEKTCPKAKGGPGWKTDEEESRRGTALGQLFTAIHFAIEHGQNHRQAEPAAAYSLPSIATTPPNLLLPLLSLWTFIKCFRCQNFSFVLSEVFDVKNLSHIRLKTRNIKQSFSFR